MLGDGPRVPRPALSHCGPRRTSGWRCRAQASSAWFWNIACTHTLMHCLLFAVFFDEERALLLDGVYGLSSVNGAYCANRAEFGHSDFLLGVNSSCRYNSPNIDNHHISVSSATTRCCDGRFSARAVFHAVVYQWAGQWADRAQVSDSLQSIDCGVNTSC